MIIIIQARFSSKRLPGKVLKKCCGKPLLKWTIERISSIKKSPKIVVATSNNDSDDNIYRFCKENNIKCFRGSLNNVIKRMIDACEEYKSSHFVRICGDSPIIDPEILGNVLEISKTVDVDIITNTFHRTYPKGQSVELIKLSALQNLFKEDLSESEKEHVTKGFYNRSDKYNILNFTSKDEKFSNVQLSVDTLDDFKKIEYLIRLEQKSAESIYYPWLKFAQLARKFEE